MSHVINSVFLILFLLVISTNGVYSESDAIVTDKITSTQSKTSNSSVETVVKEPDIRVIAKGVVCSFCAQGIKKNLEKHEAVSRLAFKDDFKEIHIILEKDKDISNKELKVIIKDAGYDTGDIIRKKKGLNLFKRLVD